MDTFFEELEVRLGPGACGLSFEFPIANLPCLRRCTVSGTSLSLTYEGDTAVVTAHVPPELKSKLAPYEKDGDPHA